MNNIDEQSELVGRVGGKVMDMSDRLEGKEKKRFLYRELNEMPLEDRVRRRPHDVEVYLEKPDGRIRRRHCSVSWQNMREIS